MEAISVQLSPRSSLRYRPAGDVPTNSVVRPPAFLTARVNVLPIETLVDLPPARAVAVIADANAAGMVTPGE